MATIRIKRTSEYINLLRDYKIFIDGQQVGTIANGEIKDFPTTVGQHIVTAKIDWCSSPDVSIDVKENQTINLNVYGLKTLNGFLLLMYYLTKGKNKYLTLEVLN
jgi:hypothetical protein